MLIASRCCKHILQFKPKINLWAAIDSNSASILRTFRDVGQLRYKNNCMTYIPVGFPLISPFFWSVSRFIGNYKSFVTRASADEDEVTEEALNQILATIENDPKSARDICAAYIDKLCRAGNPYAAFRLLQSLRDKNMFFSNGCERLLVAAAERNDIELSTQVFMDLLRSCRSLSSACYFYFARAFSKTDDSIQLVKFVEEVSELTFSEGTIVMNKIIHAFAECRQIEKALLIFDQIKVLKYKPDLITYNIVLDILGRVGRVNEMLHMFASIKEAGILPDFISYNTLLKNLRKVGRLDLCLAYFREMGESGIRPDLLTYTALIDAFGRSANIEESLRLFNDMKQRQIRPSVYIYRSLIDSLKKMGKVDLAMTLLEEMNSSQTVLAGPKDFKRKAR
ncbi:pentatricopeptide repeat-containing protein At1g11900 isoform X2 [Mangifera indica]|nr:pentatricopeptide repeat-containing protein At1g11900 isoform X2 [Mangifera indica]